MFWIIYGSGAVLALFLFRFMRGWLLQTNENWSRLEAVLRKKWWWLDDRSLSRPKDSMSGLVALLLSWAAVAYLVGQFIFPYRPNSFLRRYEYTILYRLHMVAFVLLLVVIAGSIVFGLIELFRKNL